MLILYHADMVLSTLLNIYFFVVQFVQFVMMRWEQQRPFVNVDLTVDVMVS